MYWRRLVRSGSARNLVSTSSSVRADSVEKPGRAGASAGVDGIAMRRMQSEAAKSRCMEHCTARRLFRMRGVEHVLLGAAQNFEFGRRFGVSKLLEIRLGGARGVFLCLLTQFCGIGLAGLERGGRGCGPRTEYRFGERRGLGEVGMWLKGGRKNLGWAGDRAGRVNSRASACPAASR